MSVTEGDRLFVELVARVMVRVVPHGEPPSAFYIRHPGGIEVLSARYDGADESKDRHKLSALRKALELRADLVVFVSEVWMRSESEEAMERCDRFVAEHGRLPTYSESGESEPRLDPLRSEAILMHLYTPRGSFVSLAPIDLVRGRRRVEMERLMDLKPSTDNLSRFGEMQDMLWPEGATR